MFDNRYETNFGWNRFKKVFDKFAPVDPTAQKLHGYGSIDIFSGEAGQNLRGYGIINSFSGQATRDLPRY